MDLGGHISWEIILLIINLMDSFLENKNDFTGLADQFCNNARCPRSFNICIWTAQNINCLTMVVNDINKLLL